jgi:hypothetical protein
MGQRAFRRCWGRSPNLFSENDEWIFGIGTVLSHEFLWLQYPDSEQLVIIVAVLSWDWLSKSKTFPLHAIVALGRRGGIAPTH